jgi:hypothetical protein
MVTTRPGTAGDVERLDLGRGCLPVQVAEGLEEVAVEPVRLRVVVLVAVVEEQVAEERDGDLVQLRQVLGPGRHEFVEGVERGLPRLLLRPLGEAEFLAPDLDVPGGLGRAIPRFRLTHE